MNKWLTRVKASLAHALEVAERSTMPEQNLYMLATILYSEEFTIKNDVLIQEMIDANDKQVESEWSVDEKSKYQYKFHYVSCYLFCFVVAGRIDEMKYDQIMEYICSELDLFTSDYEME